MRPQRGQAAVHSHVPRAEQNAGGDGEVSPKVQRPIRRDDSTNVLACITTALTVILGYWDLYFLLGGGIAIALNSIFLFLSLGLFGRNIPLAVGWVVGGMVIITGLSAYGRSIIIRPHKKSARILGLISLMTTIPTANILILGTFIS